MTSRIRCDGTSTGWTSAPAACAGRRARPSSSGSAVATSAASPSRLTGSRRCCLAKLIGTDVASSASTSSALRSGAVGDPELRAQRLQHVLLGDGAHLDQDLAEAPALLRLRRRAPARATSARERRHRRRRLRLEVEQQITETLLGHRGDLLTADGAAGGGAAGARAAGAGAGAAVRRRPAGRPVRPGSSTGPDSSCSCLLADAASSSSSSISTSRATRLISSSMPRLRAVVDLRLGVRPLLAAEALDELAPLLHLLLQHAPQIGLVADDVGRERDDEVRLHHRLGRVAEEEPEDRDVAQQRHLGDAVDDLVGHQAADQDGLLILGDDDRLRGPLRRRRPEVARSPAPARRSSRRPPGGRCRAR